MPSETWSDWWLALAELPASPYWAMAEAWLAIAAVLSAFVVVGVLRLMTEASRH